MSSSIKGRQVGSFVLTMAEDHQLDIVDPSTCSHDLESYQGKLIYELDEELKILAGEVAESSTYCMLLLDELTQYLRSENEVITCGLSAVSKEDAIESTEKLINNSRRRIVSLNQQIARIEEERALIINACQAKQTQESPAQIELVVPPAATAFAHF